MSPLAPEFFVHNFNCLESSQTHELLAVGYGLIRDTSVQSSGWTCGHINPMKPASHSTIFQFIWPPISISFEKGEQNARSAKDWGAPIENDDVFILDNLEEFVSTDFTSLSMTDDASTVIYDTVERHKLDLQSLSNVIPQPHIYTSSSGATMKPIKIPPYKKREPIPIPPHKVPLLVPSPYARTAWLVPVRGALPWEGCTSAIMLSPSHRAPVPLGPNTSDLITWSHVSLVSFWSFLLELRETRNVGSIGISFHASRPLPSQSLAYSGSTSSAIRNQAILESHTTTTSEPYARPLLSGVDYVKIYHEAPSAMNLRHALDVWAYKFEPSAGEGGDSKRIRVLKGARLVLVDERSKGILIS